MMDAKNDKMKNIVIIILAVFVGSLGMYLAIKYLPIEIVSMKTITETDVTVNENGIADAVDKVYDSVVTVETYKSNTKISSGTGFVYKTKDNKAYVLTNHHVIDGGTEIHLTFTDGSTVVADIVGSDQYADIAVLSVAADKILAVAEIGSSEDARVGDTVFAVGAPLDLTYSWTVTRGILSGKDRMVEVSLSNSQTSDWIMKVLQTDAAINSGNSGGPLANSNGEIIGITSLKLVSSGVEGMGFAIPIEDALEYAEKIENGESLTRPYIGISMIELNDLRSIYTQGLTVSSDVTSGVLVAEAEKNGPADNAGIKKGDVILEIDGNAVKSIAELRYYLYKHDVGDTISVKIYSDGKETTVSVKLAANS